MAVSHVRFACIALVLTVSPLGTHDAEAASSGPTSPPSTALIAAPFLHGVPRAASPRAETEGEDAAHCLSLSAGALQNGCAYQVEAVWCVDEIDCRNGYFFNMWTLDPGARYPIAGAASGRPLHLGGCKGADSVSTAETSAYSWRYHCRRAD